MGKSQFLSAVLQALFLAACSLVIYHHLMGKAYDSLSQSETWKNFTTATEKLDKFGSTAAGNFTAAGNATGTQFLNTSSSNQDVTFDSNKQESESFYKETLPLELFLNAILLSCQYFWHLWLERTFPSRPRYAEVPQTDRDYGSELREEAVVQKWVAQGKIRRASLSWWNTFVKWVMDMTVGQFLWFGLGAPLLEAAVKRTGFKAAYEEVKWGLVWRPWVPWFSHRPLSSLLSFIIVPAHRRIVFLEGMDFCWRLFLGFFAGIVLPWLSETELVQTLISGFSAEADRIVAGHTVLPLKAAGADEL